MSDQSDADGAESLPALSADGEPLAEYITRAIKADFRTAVRDRSHVTDLQAQLWPAFRPAVFSSETVTRFYEAYSKVDRNTDASRYERDLYHLWEARNPAVFPLSARMAETPQPDLGDSPWVTVTPVDRFRQLTALLGAAKARDALLGQLCDSLRQGRLQALGFLADDHAMELKPIPAARWGDSAVVCAWREGELRPRDRVPHGTPYYRGLRLACPTAEHAPQLAQSAPSTAVLQPAAEQPQSPRPHPPSKATLRQWYRRERVDTWQKGSKPPSAKDDYKAAREKFGGEFRQTVIELRKQLAPAEWGVTKPGRKNNGQ